MVNIVDVFNGGGKRHKLENGAGDEGGAYAAVYISAVGQRLGRIHRVDGRGGYHAKDLTRLVVAHDDRAAAPVECLIRLEVEVCVDRKLQGNVLALLDARNKTEARKLLLDRKSVV